MTEIQVIASKSYSVVIGSGLLKEIGTHVAQIRSNCKVAVISDSNVWPLYGNCIQSNLEAAGFTTVSYTFPAGEASKNGTTYLDILQFLAENRITRTDLLIALGGGVVGDMVGFAAATFLRGIRYVQVPTTLLAMVDSSVGGKTAIDLPAGKNLVGAFYQPALVLADIDTLKTLPEDIFRDGCAEVIKYGVLYDPALFCHLKENLLGFDTEAVIARCVELKRNVVKEDEYDTGSRQKLNLGHTIGHGVEANSGFTISHGKAVSIGMAIIAKASCAGGICAAQTYKDIVDTLNAFGLPTQCPFSAQQLYEAALSDKKRAGAAVSLILPKEIGDCIIQPTAVVQLESFIKAGL